MVINLRRLILNWFFKMNLIQADKLRNYSHRGFLVLLFWQLSSQHWFYSFHYSRFPQPRDPVWYGVFGSEAEASANAEERISDLLANSN